MIKRLKRLIIGLVLLVVVLLGAGIYSIDRIAKSGIEQGSEYALGVGTTVDGVDIGILAGRSELTALTVSNPKGFASDHFLSLGSGALAVSLGTLTKDLIEVPEFTLSGVDMNLEHVKGESNYGVILKNLERFESGDETPDEDGKKFVIRDLVIQDVKVHVNLVPLIGESIRTTIPLKEIRLKDIGTGQEKGVQIAQLSAVLIKAIIMVAIEDGGGLLPKEISLELVASLVDLEPLAEVGANLTSQADGALKQIGGLLGQDAGKQDGESAGQNLLKGVGGLLQSEKKDE